MAKLSIEELEKMTQSKFVCKQKIRLVDDAFGDNKPHIIEVLVFDGMAWCEDFKGHSYMMTYPKKSFVNLSKELSDNLKNFLELEKNATITEEHILIGYYVFSRVD